jgi:cell division septum initiation protein DivIVA
MDVEDLHRQAEWLRTAEPPRALRGFEEEQTRKLLDDAAQLLKTAAREHEALQRELEKLRAAAGEDTAAKEAIGKALLVATRAGEEIVTEAEARAAAILEQAGAAAQERERESAVARESLDVEVAAAKAALEDERTSVRAQLEEENAAARAELEREKARLDQERGEWQEVLEGERKRVLDEAEQQANAVVGSARLEVERLQADGERLRTLLAERQRHFVEIAQTALEQLQRLDEVVDGGGDGELLDDLLTPAGAGEQQAAGSAAEGDAEQSRESALTTD